MRSLTIVAVLLVGCSSSSSEPWGAAPVPSTSGSPIPGDAPPASSQAADDKHADGPVEPETVIVPRHTFDQVAYSPNGKLLVTAGEGAVVWDRETNLPGIHLRSDADPCRAVAWSPDGKLIALTGQNELRIFDPENPEPLAVYRVKERDFIAGFGWGANSDTIAVASSTGKLVELSAADASITRTIRSSGEPISVATWSPRGDAIAVAYRKGDRIAIVDPALGTDRSILFGPPRDKALALAFAPDGKRILEVWSGERSVHVIDVATGATIANHAVDVSRVVHAAWSPDGARIAVGGFDGTARVIDAATGTQTTILSGLARPVTGVAWSPDGKEIATAGMEAFTWTLAPRAITRRLIGMSAPIETLVCARDDKTLLSWDTDLGLFRWDVTTGAPTLVRSAEPAHDPRGDPFEPRMLTLAEAPDGAPLLVWDAGLVEHVGEDQPARLDEWDGAFTIAVSPDGKRLAGLSKLLRDARPKLFVWDTETGRVVSRNPDVAADRSSGLGWSRDGATLAVSSPGKVALVDPSTGGVSKLLPIGPRQDDAFGSHRASLVFSSDGASLAVGLGSHVDLFALSTSQLTRSLPGRFEPSYWTRDGKMLVDANGQGVDVASGKVVPLAARVAGSVCGASDSRWLAFTNEVGPTLRRDDGLVVALSRVALGSTWESLAMTNDGRYDGGSAAIQRARVKQANKMVALDVATGLRRDPGLMGAAFRK